MIQAWLQEKIAASEEGMLNKLAEARATFEQAGDKGGAAEAAFRALLRSYLPRNLGVGHGEVVDTFGARSKEVDVVVAADDHPFTYTDDEPGLFFVEGVSAGGEVKSILTGDELKDTFRKAIRFKRLRNAHIQGTLVTANESDLDRFYERPPFFLIAYESQLSLDTLVERVIDAQRTAEVPPGQFLDGVFVLGRGWAMDLGDGEGSLRGVTSSGERATGWLYNESEQVLFDLLGWLAAVMPRFLRFQSILSKYLLLNAPPTAV